DGIRDFHVTGVQTCALPISHALQVLGSLMLVIPLRSQVSVRALAPIAVRFVLVQLVCQAVGLLASLLPNRSGLPAAVIAGAAAARGRASGRAGEWRAGGGGA